MKRTAATLASRRGREQGCWAAAGERLRQVGGDRTPGRIVTVTRGGTESTDLNLISTVSLWNKGRTLYTEECQMVMANISLTASKLFPLSAVPLRLDGRQFLTSFGPW